MMITSTAFGVPIKKTRRQRQKLCSGRHVSVAAMAAAAAMVAVAAVAAMAAAVAVAVAAARTATKDFN